MKKSILLSPNSLAIASVLIAAFFLEGMLGSGIVSIALAACLLISLRTRPNASSIGKAVAFAVAFCLIDCVVIPLFGYGTLFLVFGIARPILATVLLLLCARWITGTSVKFNAKTVAIAVVVYLAHSVFCILDYIHVSLAVMKAAESLSEGMLGFLELYSDIATPYSTLASVCFHALMLLLLCSILCKEAEDAKERP